MAKRDVSRTNVPICEVQPQDTNRKETPKKMTKVDVRRGTGSFPNGIDLGRLVE